MTALLLIAGQLTIGASTANAHQWPGPLWHWNTTHLWTLNEATTTVDPAEWAWHDIQGRSTLHPITLHSGTAHGEIHIFESNVPGAGWCGLASVESAVEAGGHKHFTHMHATYNVACGFDPDHIQGVYCQEIGHTLGLDHSDTGDCMGLGYFYGSNGRYCFGVSCVDYDEPSHPTDDLIAIYQNREPHS